MTKTYFHEGEIKLQNQVGMRERIDAMTPHLMHNAMPDQHREFFEGLEYIFLATIGKDGRPHAAMLTGAPRFTTAPDAKFLKVITGPRTGKSALEGLENGAAVGVLGIDLSNRRRNRMHGRVFAEDENSVTIKVVQSYGNCPKYISIREISQRNLPPPQHERLEANQLSKADESLIQRSDTLFISSYIQDGSGAEYEGADMSHRGGQPGFTSIETPTQITLPDYRGNNLFNTFGNLLVNPDIGVLFVDFETGDQLHLHGTTELIEDHDSIKSVPGAIRLLRIKIDKVTRDVATTNLRWRFVEGSPVNPALTPSQ